jgi:hypothetical protein
MRRLLGILATAIAIGFGLITLLGLTTGVPLLADFARFFLQLVSVTVALTILIGILNLLSVHLGRVGRRRPGWFYSLLLVISTLAVLALTLLERSGTLSSDPAITAVLLEQVQVAVESALAGLLLFALVYGAYRVLRKRASGWGLLFVLALVIVLAGALPLSYLGLLAAARDWLMAVPVSAGARGILLGIALATVAAGIRVLIGQDRSYRE